MASKRAIRAGRAFIEKMTTAEKAEHDARAAYFRDELRYKPEYRRAIRRARAEQQCVRRLEHALDVEPCTIDAEALIRAGERAGGEAMVAAAVLVGHRAHPHISEQEASDG